MHIFVLTATYELRVSRKNHLRDHPRAATTGRNGVVQGMADLSDGELRWDPAWIQFAAWKNATTSPEPKMNHFTIATEAAGCHRGWTRTSLDNNRSSGKVLGAAWWAVWREASDQSRRPESLEGKFLSPCWPFTQKKLSEDERTYRTQLSWHEGHPSIRGERVPGSRLIEDGGTLWIGRVRWTGENKDWPTRRKWTVVPLRWWWCFERWVVPSTIVDRYEKPEEWDSGPTKINMDVREMTNRNQSVGSLEQHVAMHLFLLTLQAWLRVKADTKHPFFANKNSSRLTAW